MHSRAPVRLSHSKVFIQQGEEDDSSLREACIGWEGVEKMGRNCPSSGKAVQSCSFLQKHEKFREEGDELKHTSIQNSLVMQHSETAGLDAERRYLFGKNKPLEVKHFCSKLLKRSSKNTSG